MINHNTTYEAGTPELASGFLLMPCYWQCASTELHSRHETFFNKIIFLSGGNLLSF